MWHNGVVRSLDLSRYEVYDKAHDAILLKMRFRVNLKPRSSKQRHNCKSGFSIAVISGICVVIIIFGW